MAFESSGTILYVAKISYQSDNWFGNCYGGTKIVHRHTHIQTHTHTHKHTHTHRHTHTEAHFIRLVFLRNAETRLKKNI